MGWYPSFWSADTAVAAPDVTKVEWRIRRYHQPYFAIARAIERLCELTGHYYGCLLLNRHGGLLSLPYRWVEPRSESWEPFDPTTTTA